MIAANEDEDLYEDLLDLLPRSPEALRQTQPVEAVSE